MINGLFSQSIRTVSKATTLAAPIGGLNAYDSIANMPIQDAVLMKNLYPQPYGAVMRKGYQEWATGMSGTIESLLTYAAQDGTNKMWGVSTNGIMYDVSSSTAAPTSAVTGLANSRWQFINFANPAGSHMLAVNGSDDAIWYNGTSYIRISAGSGANQWSGLNPRDAIHITVHQRRIWVVENNSSSGWYLDVEVLFGAMTEFDFGPLFQRGGYLMALHTWSIDDGDGADDHLIAISSQGEVAVFSGIDPGSDFTLQGVYYIGAPIGRRCATKLGGETLIMTEKGVVALSESLASTKVNESRYNNYSAKIQQLLADLTTQHGANFGWEPFVYPANNMLMINVPGPVDLNQVVSNTILRSWCTFQGYAATCFGLMGGEMFFASGNIVYRGWYGNIDNVAQAGGGGSAVEAEAIQAFNYFDAPGQQKHPKMFRPTFVTDGPYSLNAIALFDFDLNTQPASVPLPATISDLWDASAWDDATWSGSLGVFRYWIQSRGIGMAITVRIRIRSVYNTYWASTDWLTESGGVL